MPLIEYDPAAALPVAVLHKTSTGTSGRGPSARRH